LNHAIVAGSQPVQALLKPLQLLDALSVRNGIVREAGAVGENLVGDLITQCIEVLLSFRRQEDLPDHAVSTFFLRSLALGGKEKRGQTELAQTP
jgi:hypothetical protein